jgi:hypothetical protein
MSKTDTILKFLGLTDTATTRDYTLAVLDHQEMTGRQLVASVIGFEKKRGKQPGYFSSVGIN